MVNRTPSLVGRKRLRPIRLTEVPLAVRRRCGAPIVKSASDSGNLDLAVELTRAIEYPSDNLYWVGMEEYESPLLRAASERLWAS